MKHRSCVARVTVDRHAQLRKLRPVRKNRMIRCFQKKTEIVGAEWYAPSCQKKMNFTCRTLCAVTNACSVTDACGYFDAKRLCPVQNYRRSRCFEKMFPKEGRNVLGTMPDAQLCSRFLSCRDGRPSRAGRAAPLQLLLP